MKVFGCKAYILRRKLDAKCKQVRFVGYSETSKGYRFLYLNTDKIIISRDAIFDENDIAED